MSMQMLKGVVSAVLLVGIVVFLHTYLAEFAPPRALDIFLAGIGLLSYFSSWVPALFLFAASLPVAVWLFPVHDMLDALQLAVYSLASFALIAGIHRLKAAISAWKRTEETYRTIFEDASDAIVITDEGLRILEANSRLSEMLGYSREELLRMTIPDFVHPEDLERQPLEFEQVLREGRTVINERRLRRKDGRLIAAEVSVRRLRDGRLIAIGRDITERRRAEEALRESEAVTRSVVETAVDGIVMTDEAGIICSFNPAAERLFGYTAAEVWGKNITMLMPSPHREEHDGYVRRYLKTGEQRVIGIGREAAAMRKDGSTFPVDLALSEMALPGRRMFTCIIRDISLRKQAEEAIREAHDKLHALIEACPLAIFTLAPDGRVRQWNSAAERIFGWTEAEVLDRRLPIVPESEVADFQDIVRQTIAGQRMRGVERRRLTKDGTLIDVSIWNAPLRHASGEISGIMCVVADITERIRLEEQLRQAQKMEAVGRLAGGVAHDFNNMLTVITGYSRMLLDRFEPDSEARAEIEEILKSAEHASALTGQLLVFSRRHVVQRKVIGLNEIIARLEKMLGRVIGEDIELTAAPAACPDRIRADAVQIEQMILNLVVNARDAMPGGGRLILETANAELDSTYAGTHIGVRPGRYVMLAVSDTGVGMNAEIRSRLFEPFFTTKEKGKGTGLGLSMVYGIVKQSGGDIWVYSEPGRGTTFKIYLPQVEEGAEEPAAPRFVETAGGSETILLVEDEAGVRRLVRSILEQRGYAVLEAKDPEHALRLCGENSRRIDLLITDVVMPEMNGRELAAEAARMRPALKVLYMSGYTDNALVHHGVKGLGPAFLQKPFTPAALAKRVRELLDSPSPARPAI
jgi:two-component system cell cycle sensor histidine kinase/response regulator CckA